MDNPWGLTPAESRAMTALTEFGCSKLAGRALGLSPKTIDVHAMNAMSRMQCRNRTQAVIKWDRWLQIELVLPQIPLSRIERINMRLVLRLRQACQMAEAA